MLPAVILANFLIGCAHGTSETPAPDKPAVQIGRDCENLARNVPDPHITERTDPRLGTGEFAGALDEANGNLTATRQCQAHQRERLAKGK